MKTIVIIENSADITPLLEYCRNTDDIILVAVEPDVAETLMRKSISFTPIEKYYNKSEIIEQGMKNFLIVSSFCADLDRCLQDQYPELREYNLKPLGDNFLFFKVLFDSCTIRIHALTNIIRHERPDQVICGCRAIENGVKKPILIPIKPFDRYDRLYGIIAPCFSDQVNVTVIPLRDPLEQNRESLEIRAKKSSERIVHALARGAEPITPHFINLWFFIKHASLSETIVFILYSIYNRIRPCRNLVILGYGYDWNRTLYTLYRRGFRIYHYREPRGSNQEPYAEHRNFSTGGILPRYCIYLGINFSQIVAGRLIPRIGSDLQSIDVLLKNSEQFLKTKKPVGILCSTKNNFSEHTFARIARILGIPVISWQHGEQGHREKVLISQYSEILNSDFHFCFGPAVKEQFQADSGNGGSCKHIPVGSCELDELFRHSQKGIHAPQRRIMYAMTNYYQNNLYISSPLIIEDNPLWNSQKKIIDILGKETGDHIIKIHPSSYPTKHLIQHVQERYPHLIVKKDEQFIDLLHDADIIILDFPSTTLLQAVAAGKIVFVLLKHSTPTHQAISLLRKRAYCYNEPEDLAKAIEIFLCGEPLDQDPDSNNIEFLQAYGITELDGNVAGRAVDALDAIIDGTIQ